MTESDKSDASKQAARVKLLRKLRDHEDCFPSQLADRFPAILEKIARLWEDTAQTHAYLQQLLVTQREGRQGFPEDVYREIYNLFELHNRMYPPAERVSDDFWTWVNPGI